MVRPALAEDNFKQVSDTGITHSVLAFGAETYLLNAKNEVTWRYQASTRDGWMLPNGHILMTISKSSLNANGAIVEVDRQGNKFREIIGTMSEVDNVQPLPNDGLLYTESGPNARLVELDKNGKIVVTFPLQCQKEDFHMQTRMVRKLKNGNYLVPHLIDKVVKEYDKTGKVVWQASTPHWAFTAIRLDNGNTLVGCTRGNLVVELDSAGKIVWQVTNDDLPGAPLKDCCGVMRLPNGNTVITSYGSGGENEVKLTEVTPEKKIVWQLYTGQNHGIHEFQILDEKQKPLKGRPLK